MTLDVKIPPSKQREKPLDSYNWIGKDVRRLEDPKLLRGSGVYIDDVSLPGMLHAAILRSPYAHARILRIEKSVAQSLPGVFSS